MISGVEAGGLAERVGLRAGDELRAINGQRLRDVIDVQFVSSEEHLALEVCREGQTFAVEAERRYGEPLGLDFVEPTFDGIRRCGNGCEFCFVSQMPPGLRRSVYVKDDDYRYSFLFGNYVTLTNLDEADWVRIGEQHLSPLYVSVHATEPGLRRRVLGNSVVPDVMDQLRRLADLGIEVHAQVVVVPGLNDGCHLDRSIGELSGLYPAVRSVGVVPVGLTRYHQGGCRVHTLGEARSIFRQVTSWQVRLRARLGVNFVYLSDEWYLRLGEAVPLVEAYDGLDLTENGVGLVAGFEVADSKLQSVIRDFGSVTLVTGMLFAPVLRKAVAGFEGVDVVAVVNRFFGETVTVAGLLTGEDVGAQLRAQLRERTLGEAVVLPEAMFGGPEGQSLDEMWPEEVGKVVGRRVVGGGNLGLRNTR